MNKRIHIRSLIQEKLNAIFKKETMDTFCKVLEFYFFSCYSKWLNDENQSQ
jgi:hypothetical protein